MPDNAAIPTLRTQRLVKSFGGTIAVNDVDLTVGAGQVHGLLGPNGAGKSTMLAMVLGLTAPDSGSIEFFGTPAQSRGGRLADGVAGFVEGPRFYPYLSARRNLAFLASMDDRPDGVSADDTIEKVLALTSLSDKASSRVGDFSVGMKQRLGIAAALMRNPRLLVLDEPTSGLDPAGMRDMRTLIRRLAADGTTVLVSSHDMNEIDASCDGVTILRAGRVAFSGSLAELRAKAATPTYLMHTSSDTDAATVADRIGGLEVRMRDGGLVVRAVQADVDRFVVALGKTEIAVRSLRLESSALQALFFALTEGDDQRRAA